LAAPKQVVPIVVGPTAIGKTAVAFEIARKIPITVISADSRQVYRGLDIGTAKPTPEELRAVPHFGLDVVEPGTYYSAGRFAADAAEWIRSVPNDRLAIVVGGTGFYVRALAEGLFREPPMDKDRRTRFRDWTRSAEGLSRWASRLDSGYAGGGRQRSARAVEVALLTGRPLTWWQRQAQLESQIRPWYVRLTAPRATLHKRIEGRVDRMLADGLVEEVLSLLERGVPPDAPGLNGVGYREVVQHLSGEFPFAELAGKIAASTRRYAKRQETWFRHQLRESEVLVLDVTDGPTTLAERFIAHWEGREDRCESE
jgi:tRNA dimethylallyltransferase